MHSNRSLCSSCRLRKQVDHYERCLICASKRSRVTTSNILLLTEQANAVAKPLRASKRLSFKKEIDDNMLVFTRGDVRFVRIEGLSFRIDCLQYFNVDDLSKMTRHALGHGLMALLDSERRCVLYHGGTEVAPILERVVLAAPGADEGRRFVCSTAGRGVVQFKFPGPSHLPEVYNQRLKEAKDGGFWRRTCKQKNECYLFRWKTSSRSANYEKRCAACVAEKNYVCTKPPTRRHRRRRTRQVTISILRSNFFSY